VEQQGHVSGKLKHSKSYKNFVLLVVSNLVCWIPLELLMVLFLAGVPVPTEVMNWFSVFILPLNAMTNPFLYTIRVIGFKVRSAKPGKK